MSASSHSLRAQAQAGPSRGSSQKKFVIVWCWRGSDCAQACTNAGGCGVSRARSVRQMTTAPAPSVSRQLSNRHSGSDTHRADRYSSRVSGRSCIVAAGLALAWRRKASATLARWSRVAPYSCR